MKILGCGFVYMITCNITGKNYVGSTKNPNRRWRDYRSLRCKTQVKLYNSFKKYGIENHTFEIVWSGELNEMLKYETLIGWGFDVLEETGLNIMLPKYGDIYSPMNEERIEACRLRMVGNTICLGNKHSEETKHKIGKSNLGKPRSKELRDRLSKYCVKPVLQYDLEGNFVKEWFSISQACKALGLFTTNVSKSCKSQNKTVGGFYWKYKYE
jgi:group I intron endonuclease